MEVLQRLRKTKTKFYWNDDYTEFTNDMKWDPVAREYIIPPGFENEDEYSYEISIKFKLIDITYSSVYMGNANMICYIEDVETRARYRITNRYIPMIIDFLNQALERQVGYPTMKAKTTNSNGLIPIELL